MSRLYIWVRSDKSETERTKEGKENIEAQINYGDREHSYYLCEMVVTWHKGEEKPSVRFLISSGIEYEVSHVN